MKNCVAKLEKNEDKKIKRWNLISEAASKQSKRNFIPIVNEKITMNELYSKIKEYNLVIVAYENENKVSLKDILKENEDAKKIAIVIGPEGGFTENEISNLLKNNAKIVSLGKRILRTETASLALLSMIIYEYEL